MKPIVFIFLLFSLTGCRQTTRVDMAGQEVGMSPASRELIEEIVREVVREELAAYRQADLPDEASTTIDAAKRY